jgi:hypothetical protein
VSLWDNLQRFLNADIIARKKPAPAPPRPSRATGGPDVRHLGSPDQPAIPTVRYTKERMGPRIRGTALVPPSVRKRILVALAGVSLLAMLGLGVASLVADRRLPFAVTGLWRSDVPSYQGRIIELRSRYVAFLIDTLGHVVSHQISRVQQTPDVDGVLYRVQFNADSSGRTEFSFVYDQGPPEHLRFAHQRQITWKRERMDRSLMMR